MIRVQAVRDSTVEEGSQHDGTIRHEEEGAVRSRKARSEGAYGRFVYLGNNNSRVHG